MQPLLACLSTRQGHLHNQYDLPSPTEAKWDILEDKARKLYSHRLCLGSFCFLKSTKN